MLLNFWATWCHGCKTEIPWYKDFQSKYEALGFTVVGASVDDARWKVVTPFVKSQKVNYPVVIASEELVKRYAVGEMPLSVLIDREGRIADSHAGVVDRGPGNQRFSACSARHSENDCVSRLTISEVAGHVGLKPSAIRCYEHLGTLLRADRVSGQRRYDRTVLYRLAVVQRARQAGFTLDEIKALFVGFAEGTRAILEKGLSDVRRHRSRSTLQPVIELALLP